MNTKFSTEARLEGKVFRRLYKAAVVMGVAVVFAIAANPWFSKKPTDSPTSKAEEKTSRPTEWYTPLDISVLGSEGYDGAIEYGYLNTSYPMVSTQVR